MSWVLGRKAPRWDLPSLWRRGEASSREAQSSPWPSEAQETLWILGGFVCFFTLRSKNQRCFLSKSTSIWKDLKDSNKNTNNSVLSGFNDLQARNETEKWPTLERWGRLTPQGPPRGGLGGGGRGVVTKSTRAWDWLVDVGPFSCLTLWFWSFWKFSSGSRRCSRLVPSSHYNHHQNLPRS